MPRYWYGYATDASADTVTIHAYTTEEWGLGGNHPAGGNYRARTLTGLGLVTALMTIPAVLAPLGLLFGIVVLVRSIADGQDMFMGPTIIVASLACTALFSGGWLLGVRALRQEWRARRLRHAKGLPRPSYAVTDDQARTWFERHPGTVEITRDNFPHSARPFPGEASYVAPAGARDA